MGVDRQAAIEVIGEFTGNALPMILILRKAGKD
jgi:hypothetical protein